MIMNYGDLITVVTLCYKNYSSIYESIDSVLCQDYPNIEYIISDDGYPGFPKEKIDKYLQHKCKSNITNCVVRSNTENVGTVKHSNLVCEITKGEYFVELSCGDSFYEPNTVSKIVKEIIENDSDIYIFSRLVCDEEGNEKHYIPHRRNVKKASTLNGRSQYEAIVWGHFWAAGSATVYNTDYVKENKFDEKYFLIEDYPMFTSYTWENKIHCNYDIVSIKYRLGGVSNTPNLLIKKDMEIYDKYDRGLHIDELSFWAKEKVRFRLSRSGKITDCFLIFRFPHIVILCLLFKINDIFGILTDKVIIKSKK